MTRLGISVPVAVAFVVGLSVLAAPVEAEQTVPPEWQALDRPGLTALALSTAGLTTVESLDLDPASTDGLTALGAYVGQRYADTAAQGPINHGDWLDLMVVMGRYVPASQKPAMAQAFKAALAPTVAALGQMDAGKAVKSIRIVERLGDTASATALACGWIGGSDQFKSASVVNLEYLTRITSGAGDQGTAAQKRLADQVLAGVLATPDQVRAATPKVLAFFAQQLNGVLSDETKATWAGNIKAGFDNAPLQMSEFMMLTTALDKLKDPGLGAFVAGRVEGIMAWESCTVGDLASLAGKLPVTGDVGRAARVKLADVAGTKCFADVASVRAAGFGTLLAIVSKLSKDVPTETQGAWASKVRAACVDDAAAYASLNASDVQTVTDILGNLGDKQAAASVTAKWAEAPAAVQSFAVKDMVALMGRLTAAGDAGRPARLKMAEAANTKCFADATSIKAAGLVAASTLVWGLHKDLTAETKAAWTSTIRAAYVDDAAAFGALKLGEAQTVADMLNNLGDKQGAATIAKWADTTNTLPTLSAQDMGVLAGRLGSTGDAGKSARARLMDVAGTKVFTDAASARTAGMGPISSIVWNLWKDMSVETRTAWASVTRAAYLDDVATFGALKVGDVRSLEGVLRVMGDKQSASSAAAKWFDSTIDWQTLKVEDLSWLANALSLSGDPFAAQRGRLRDHVVRSRSADLSTASPRSLSTWGDLANSLQIPAASRMAWADLVRQTYAGDAQRLFGLKIDELDTVCGFLNKMGDARGPLLAAKYVTGTEVWKDWDSPVDVQRLMRLLPSAGDPAKAARKLLVDHVTVKFIGDSAKIAARSTGFWRGFVEVFNGDLTPGNRRAWAQAISGVFAATLEAAMALNIRDFKDLVGSLGPLAPSSAGSMALAWLSDPPRRAAASVADSTQLVQWALQVDPQATSALMDKMDESWQTKDAAEPAAPGQVVDMWECLVKAGKADKARAWALRLYSTRVGTDAARQVADSTTALVVSELLWRSGLTQKHESYPAYGAALATLVRKGADINGGALQCRFYARALCAPETRQVLEDDLLDDQGSPRLAAARILAWAYRENGVIQQWRDKVEAKIAASQGDAKALWQVVKGFTEPLVQDPPNLMRRGHWLKVALATAATEQVKLVVLRELAESFRDLQRPGAGADMMDSVKGQFGQESVAAIASLQSQLRQDQSRLDAEGARARSAARVAQIQGTLSTARRNLAAAQAAGDSQAVAEIQAATDRLEKELDSIGK